MYDDVFCTVQVMARNASRFFLYFVQPRYYIQKKMHITGEKKTRCCILLIVSLKWLFLEVFKTCPKAEDSLLM